MRPLVIIPALNEEHKLAKLLPRIPKGYDVLVIDDGSTDNTAALSRKFKCIVLVHKVNQGVGASLRDGFEYAIRKRYAECIVVNADLQHPPQLIPTFFKELRKGYDVILGSRLMGDSSSMPFVRKLGNAGFAFIVNTLFGTRYTDVTCGMRAFKTQKLKGILSDEQRYGVEIDMSIKMRNLKVKELLVPTIYAANTSHMNVATVWKQMMLPVLKNFAKKIGG